MFCSLYQRIESSYSLENKAPLQSGGTALDSSVSFARWHQGEQTVAGSVSYLCILWAPCRHLTTLMSLMHCKWVPLISWVVLINGRTSCPRPCMNHVSLLYFQSGCFQLLLLKTLTTGNKAVTVLFFFFFLPDQGTYNRSPAPPQLYWCRQWVCVSLSHLFPQSAHRFCWRWAADCSPCTTLQDCWFPPDITVMVVFWYGRRWRCRLHTITVEFSWCLVGQSRVRSVSRRLTGLDAWRLSCPQSSPGRPPHTDVALK